MIDAIARGRHLFGTAALEVMTFAGSLRLFEILWHRDALADVARQPGGWIGAIGIAAGSAVVHELLHGLGWYTFARVPWRSITFRPTWRVMGVVARAKVAVPIRAYRAGTALPALVLAVVTVALGLLTGIGLLVLWGLFFLLECFTDIATLLATSNVPARAWVRDHPDKLGCRIVTERA